MKFTSLSNPWAVLAGISLMFAAVPASSNYTLKSYDLGTGGTGSSSSSNYKLQGISGAQSGTSSQPSSSNFNLGPGVANSSNSNVPPAPTLSNPSGYYDRLKLVLNAGNNPADTKFLVAISSDGFVTTKYIQADTSIGTSQAVTNYQTYAARGSSGGFTITGLTSATTYQVKVKALQGDFTGSAYGPTASAATVTSTMSVGLTTTLTSTPPFAISFSTLNAGSVTNGNADAIIGLSSNAAHGGTVYVKSANGGLLSPSTGSTIASASADLSSASLGYGGQVTSVSQGSDGPLSKLAPFNGASNNVGNLQTNLLPVMRSPGPITNGSGSIRLMAKPGFVTQSANDYADILTFIVAMEY